VTTTNRSAILTTLSHRTRVVPAVATPEDNPKMEDMVEAIVSKMYPIEPAGYTVEICGSDHKTTLLEAKGVEYNGKIMYMVRSARSAKYGEEVAPRETWESQLCPSDVAFRFLVLREYVRLGCCFVSVYATCPEGSRHRIDMNPYNVWDDFDEVNKRGLDHMIAAMSMLKVPQNGLFVW